MRAAARSSRNHGGETALGRERASNAVERSGSRRRAVHPADESDAVVPHVEDIGKRCEMRSARVVEPARHVALNKERTVRFPRRGKRHTQPITNRRKGDVIDHARIVALLAGAAANRRAGVHAAAWAAPAFASR